MRKTFLEIIRISSTPDDMKKLLGRRHTVLPFVKRQWGCIFAMKPIIALLLFAMPFFAQAQNPISIENALPGNPSTEWDIIGAGDLNIQGFATQISVNKGQTVAFKISSPSAYTIDIYRLGYYAGNGARKVSTGNPVIFDAALPQTQPADLFDATTGKVSCSNWAQSAHWNVPSTAVSGVYIAKLTKTSDGGSSHIAFIVRDDAGNSPMLVKTSDATWQAYNGYGGNSLYVGTLAGYPQGHATKVSYDRPFITRNGNYGGGAAQDWLFNAEYPMIRWLERNGYNVSYTTDVDMDRDPIGITPTGAGGTYNHKVIISMGHDEYWSLDERTKVENARNAGVHTAFFSGNEVYWKTRWEDNHRTLVCYKEGTMGENICGTKCDVSTTTWTGLWRDGDPTTYPGSDGGKPENSLTGQVSWLLGEIPLVVPDTYKGLRFWRNTSVATLGAGQTATFPTGTLGYEFSFEQPAFESTYPKGRIVLSSTDYEGHTHKTSLYRHSSGALVFGAGNIQWSWGLDGTHDRGNAAPSADMQQATVNLFADMGVQPATLQSGLTAATASTDFTKPSSIITFPLDGGSVQQNSNIIINGTSADAGGGVLAGVEVSTDGGITWHLASGTTNWTYTWTPTSTGSVTIKVRGYDDSGNMESVENANNVHTVTVAPFVLNCPCNLFPSNLPITTVPGNEGPITVGVKFQSTVNGYITGVRFYKDNANIGTHVGQLWSSTGQLLANAIFTSESANGWQQVDFGTPVAITSGTTYVAAYRSTNGGYSVTDDYFTTTFTNGPLLSLGDGVDGPNGVYIYSSASAFPDQTFRSSNYWVDVVFNVSVPPDVTPPLVISVSPANNSTQTPIGTTVSASFDEMLDPASVTNSTVFLKDAGNNLVSATVSYNASLQVVVLTPSSPLAYSSTYTATIKGGTGYDRIKDIAGNALAADYTWSFTTVPPPNPPPTLGLGGPVLVIKSSSNPFSLYAVEMLRAEGINSFDVKDITQVDATTLNNYDVAILGEMTVSAANVTTFSDWVTAGGTLIAFRPASNLNALMGLNASTGTLAEGYLRVNTASGPGVGITTFTLQYHGVADLHTLTGGATTLATLYSNATTPTTNPAVTQRLVGANGGRAVAFTYDLAKSVIYTRQGNPAWAGQKRDGTAGPIRSDDLFFPGYVDFSKIEIPQADEQQRLLNNIIIQGNLHKKPLPKFWFLPRKLKAAVVMTGDDHAAGGTKGRFDHYMTYGNNSAQDVLDWKAIRSTSYIYSSTDNSSVITNAEAVSYESQGFEIAAHITTNLLDWTSQSDLDNTYYTPQLLEFSSKWPGLHAPVSNRTHGIAWSDWASQPKVELLKGIRLDVNYYYWPASWIQDRPGLFTGSGMPMRFADIDGTLIDCYQVTTQMPDESSITFPGFIDKLLDNATGPLGYYGVFTANMHTDSNIPTEASVVDGDAIIASAQARQIPVISAKQLLTWLDGRNGSNFNNIVWNNNILTFDVSLWAGAYKLQGMVPVQAATGTLNSITLGGVPVSYTIETIKGIQYAFFDAVNGSYAASYVVDVTPPVISNVVATPNPDGTVTITWTTNEPSTSVIDYGLVSNSLNLNSSDLNNLVTNHSVTLTGLNAGTVYYYRVTSADAQNNSSSSPASPGFLSFLTTSAVCASDVQEFDFNSGTISPQLQVVKDGNGAVILKPTLNEEFTASNPPGWTWASWGAGSSVSYLGGILVLENSHLYSDPQSITPGTSIEFSANFTNGNFQNVGFSGDQAFGNPWLTIGRGTPSDNSVSLRSSSYSEIILGTNLTGGYHRYKINWNATEFRIYVDGVEKAIVPLTIGQNMYMQISDAVSDGASLQVDWIRVSPFGDPTGTGTFTSRVLDGGSVNHWDKISYNSIVPAGAGIAVNIRTGNSPVVDGTWTGFVPRANGDQVGSSSRYIQYQATLTTNNLQNTPVLQDVSFSCLAAFPVTLINLRGNANGKDVKLEWSTATETNNRGFNVERSIDGRNWITVGFVPGAGNSNILMNYTFTDKNLANGKYLYRLRQIDFDGRPSYSGIINISLTDKQDFSLGQNHPNPFNGTTIIPYSISTNSHVRISIFDMHGRVIRVMDEGQRRAGQYSIQVSLSELRKGVYFYKMEADGFTSTRKMVIQ